MIKEKNQGTKNYKTNTHATPMIHKYIKKKKINNKSRLRNVYLIKLGIHKQILEI